MAVPEEEVSSTVQPFDVLARIETFDDPRSEMMVAFHKASRLDVVDHTTSQEVVTYAALLRDVRTQRASEVMPHSSLAEYFVDDEWFKKVTWLDCEFLLSPAVTALERVLVGPSALRDVASVSTEAMHLFEDENTQLLEDLRADLEERVPERLVFGQLRLELSLDATTDAFVGENPHTGEPAVSGTELSRILRKLADGMDGHSGRQLQEKDWTLYDTPGRPVGKATTLAL